MRSVSILFVGVALLVLSAARPASAEGWSLPNPFASKESKQAEREPAAKPSPLKKFQEGTKRLFAKTRDKLTGRKPPKKKPTNQYVPWIRPPREEQPERKQSWLTSLFRRKEPKPVKTMDDWWQLKRMDP